MNTHEAKMFHWNTSDLDFLSITFAAWITELSVTPVFDAVLPAEMTNVDSNDSQTSPDSERLLQIGYVPLTHQVVQAHACTVPCLTQFLHLASDDP